MRWFVVAGSPPLSCRPSRVAHAQPPGPGLPEHAPSVQTSRTPGGTAWLAASPDDASPDDAVDVPAAVAPVGQTTCAHPEPDFLICSPGSTGPEQALQT